MASISDKNGGEKDINQNDKDNTNTIIVDVKGDADLKAEDNMVVNNDVSDTIATNETKDAKAEDEKDEDEKAIDNMNDIIDSDNMNIIDSDNMNDIIDSDIMNDIIDSVAADADNIDVQENVETLNNDDNDDNANDTTKETADKEDGDKEDGDKEDGDKEDGDKENGDKENGDKENAGDTNDDEESLGGPKEDVVQIILEVLQRPSNHNSSINKRKRVETDDEQSSSSAPTKIRRVGEDSKLLIYENELTEQDETHAQAEAVNVVNDGNDGYVDDHQNDEDDE